MFIVSCYSLNGSLHSVVTKNFLDFGGQIGILKTERNVGWFPTLVRNVCVCVCVCVCDGSSEWRERIGWWKVSWFCSAYCM